MSKRVLAMAAAGLTLSILSGPVSAACVARSVGELPVTIQGGQLQVPVMLNGQVAPFVVNSDTFLSYISDKGVAELNLKNRSFGSANYVLKSPSGREKSLLLAPVKGFALGAAPFRSVSLAVYGTGPVGGPGSEAVGVLGQDILGVLDVEYDLSRSVIRLFATAGCARAALAYWAGDKPYSVIDVKPAAGGGRGHPIQPHSVAEVFINGVKVRAAIDTTASTTLISRGAARRAGIEMDAPGVVRGEGAVKNWIAPVASFRIGQEDVRDTRLRVVERDWD